MTVVLDSWAVLRYLEDTEPAAGLVAELLGIERPLMSSINLGEVHYVRRSHGEEAAIETVRDLREVIDVRLPDERLVLDAARIKAGYPMAFAGAFGAALSISQDAMLWTGDPELLVEDFSLAARSPAAPPDQAHEPGDRSGVRLGERSYVGKVRAEPVRGPVSVAVRRRRETAHDQPVVMRRCLAPSTHATSARMRHTVVSPRASVKERFSPRCLVRLQPTLRSLRNL